MTLTDAGPLVALLDADEVDHQRCKETIELLQLPLLTTWPAFTEAMYLIGRAGGWQGQDGLWKLVLRGDLTLASSSPSGNKRAAHLMETYADRPMDLADATLVALGEERGIDRIFTLDTDFHIYRLKGRRRFKVLPA